MGLWSAPQSCSQSPTTGTSTSLDLLSACSWSQRRTINVQSLVKVGPCTAPVALFVLLHAVLSDRSLSNGLIPWLPFGFAFMSITTVAIYTRICKRFKSHVPVSADAEPPHTSLNLRSEISFRSSFGPSGSKPPSESYRQEPEFFQGMTRRLTARVAHTERAQKSVFPIYPDGANLSGICQPRAFLLLILIRTIIQGRSMLGDARTMRFLDATVVTLISRCWISRSRICFQSSRRINATGLFGRSIHSQWHM